jgi:hypothetical protein
MSGLKWPWAGVGVAAKTAMGLLGCLALGGCLGPMPVPLLGVNRQLEQAGSNRQPSLAGRWLAVINSGGGMAPGDGRERVLLLDLERQLPVPLPGLNRPDAQPLSVSVDASGERLALVRHLDGRTELLLYRRSLQSLQPIPLAPPGVPLAVQLRADGRELAVQMSRNGLWQVDLIQIP